MAIMAVAGGNSIGGRPVESGSPSDGEGVYFDSATNQWVYGAPAAARSVTVSPTLSADHSYSGITTTQAVGETVAFGDLLYFDWADAEWKIAAKGAAATTPAMAIALEAKNNGEACLLLLWGAIRDDSDTFTAAMVLLGAAGAPTSTLSGTAGDQVQRVGIAFGAHTWWFMPSTDVVEVPA